VLTSASPQPSQCPLFAGGLREQLHKYEVVHILFVHTKDLLVTDTKQVYCKRLTFQEFYTLSTCFDITISQGRKFDVKEKQQDTGMISGLHCCSQPFECQPICLSLLAELRVLIM